MTLDNLPENLTSYIDVAAGLGRIMGNTKVYLRLLGIFADSKEFDSFKETLESGDFEKASEIAHTIKGMTGNLSLTKLYDISSTLNIELKAGKKDDDLIAQLFDAKDKTLEFIGVLQNMFA